MLVIGAIRLVHRQEQDHGRFDSHRIRHYGLLANGARKTNLALARELLHVLPAQGPPVSSETHAAEIPIAAPPAFICRHCGHAMNILQTFVRGESIRAPPGGACTP